MMRLVQNKFVTREMLLGGLSGLAVLAVVGVVAVPVALIAGAQAAYAQDDGHGGGGGSGGQGGSGQGAGGPGGGGSGGHDDGGDHEDGGGHDGGSGGGGHDGGEGHEGGAGQGQGGQGQGGQGGSGEGGQGQGGPGGQGEGSAGRPPWAAEGIPEVELGRLNVARSPAHVLDRAYAEALAQLAGMATFYNLSLEQMIAQLSQNWDNVMLLDSPLQNLAIFRDALDGSLDLSAYGISNDRETLMAVAIGIASDKTIPVTPETVYAVSVILEMPLSQDEATAIAAQAEAIRVAVLTGHG